jgi:hypothetical protein
VACRHEGVTAPVHLTIWPVVGSRYATAATVRVHGRPFELHFVVATVNFDRWTALRWDILVTDLFSGTPSLSVNGTRDLIQYTTLGKRIYRCRAVQREMTGRCADGIENLLLRLSHVSSTNVCVVDGLV